MVKKYKKFALNINNNQNGFVVLIAVMIVTIIVTLGTGILNIAFKDLIIANAHRESLKAFAAADAGIECAFAYDVNPLNAPPPPTFASTLYITSPGNDGVPALGSSILCNNTSLGTDDYRLYLFSAPEECDNKLCYVTKLYDKSVGVGSPLVFSDGSCVFIEVRKILTNPPGSGAVTKEMTEIEARGINDCDGSRRVERKLLLRWESI